MNPSDESQAGPSSLGELRKDNVLPAVIDKLQEVSLGYEAALVEGLGLPPQTQAQVDRAKFSKKPMKTLTVKNPPDATPLEKFKENWRLLRDRCREPRTIRTVVDTSRKDILTILKSSKVTSKKTIDLLDEKWDVIGSSGITRFITYFLTDSTDFGLTTGPGPYAYLIGVINTISDRDHRAVGEMMEGMALVSADLKLSSESSKSFCKSISSAEKVWRAQSSLISEYTCKLEAQLKTMLLLTERNQSETPREAPVKDTPKHPDQQLKYDHFIYHVDKEGQVTIKTDKPPSPQDELVIRQVKVFLKKASKPQALLEHHPVKLTKAYWKYNEDPNEPSGVELLESLLLERGE